MEVLDHFIDIENLTKEEEEIIEIEGIIFSQSSNIFLVDFEDDGFRIGVNRCRVLRRCESLPFRS